jgi:hypothetical protein
MGTVLTSRNHAISVTIGGGAIPGFWKTLEGGALTTETTTNRPGGMASRMVLATTAERDEVTVGREYDYVRDSGLTGPGGYIDAAVELGMTAQVTVQPLNPQTRQPVGRPIVYSGVASGSTPPEWDSESTDVQSFTFTIAVEN